MPRALAAAVLIVAGLTAAAPAQANITRIAGPSSLLSESRMFVRFDTAFDTTNRVYLMVWGTQRTGPVNGLFLSESGAPIGNMFAISSGTVQSGWARVIYSEEQGKFLVSYTKIKGAGNHEKLARFVTYSAGSPSMGGEIWLDAWNGNAGNEAGLAYATATNLFFVTWDYPVGVPSSKVATIDANGTVLKTTTLTDVNFRDGQSDPEIACDPDNRRCLIVGWAWGFYSGGKTALWGRFIDDATGNPQGADSFYLPAGGYLEQPTVTFSASASRFIVAYTSSGQVWGNVANAATDAIGASYPLLVSNSSTIGQDGGGYGFSTIVYNSRSNTSAVASVPWSGLPAVQEIDANGAPIGGSREYIPNSGGVGRPDPWEYKSKYVIPTANTVSNEFLIIDNHLFNLFRLSRLSAGPSCSFTLSSTSANYTDDSGGQTITVAASDPSCEWTAVSNVNWLTITSAAAGTGATSVSYTVAASMSTLPRTGTLTIGGLTYTVSQAGVPCNYSINPTAHSILSGATTGGGINVTTTVPSGVTGGCRWSAGSAHPGLSFQNGSGRVDSGTVTFNVTGNYSTTPRVLTASVAGRTFTLSQDGAPTDAASKARENKRADLSGDGFNDLLWQDTSNGYLATWTLQGTHVGWSAESSSIQVRDTNWRVAGTGDFNGDGNPDLVWRHEATGALYLWYMDGLNRIGEGTPFSFSGEPDLRWKIVGIGDFNADGNPDLVWQHDTGWLTVYLMDGKNLIGSQDITPGRVLDTRWRIVGVGDLNADGGSDLIFQHSASGELAGWIMNGTRRAQYLGFFPGAILDLNWRLAAVLDVNDDQAVDLVWQNSAQGAVAVWYMNGTHRIAAASFPRTVGRQWMIVGPR